LERPKEKTKDDKDKRRKSKPYKTTFGETYVEPVGMGPAKEK